VSGVCCTLEFTSSFSEALLDFGELYLRAVLV
jgi:hypothetical protein